MRMPCDRCFLVPAMFILFSASFGPILLGAPAASQPSHSKPASQPATDSQRYPLPADVSADECLAIASDLIEQDDYPRARRWIQAALDREPSPATKIRAQEAMSRLDLLGSTAPKLSVSEWIQGGRPMSRNLEGKVIVLLFFESIDPLTKHDIQALSTLTTRYRSDDFEAIGIASVAGDAEYQQPDDIRRFVAEQRITFRVGLDEGGVMTLHTYKGETLPHHVLIDRSGRVRRAGPMEPHDLDFAVRRLLAEKRGQPLRDKAVPMPTSRSGRELIDTRAPRLNTTHWANLKDGSPPRMTGHVRLIRFLMSDCAYCRATVPALNQIHRDYAERGLEVVGVYHPKPGPRKMTDEEFQSVVRRLEPGFPCALDADWNFLRRFWLNAGDAAGDGPKREFTSATFLIDRRGRIRFVHPGPDYFPSDAPEKARQNEDYAAIRIAVEKLLAE